MGFANEEFTEKLVQLGFHASSPIELRYHLIQQRRFIHQVEEALESSKEI